MSFEPLGSILSTRHSPAPEMALTLLLGGQLIRLPQASHIAPEQEDTTTLPSVFVLWIYVCMPLTVHTVLCCPGETVLGCV